MDLARGYGWVKSKLGLRPNGARGRKVRTGLSSFRDSFKQPARGEPVKVTRPVSRPAAKKSPARKPAARKGKKGGFRPLDSSTIKPPAGVRPIRRVPTRVTPR